MNWRRMDASDKIVSDFASEGKRRMGGKEIEKRNGRHGRRDARGLEWRDISFRPSFISFQVLSFTIFAGHPVLARKQTRSRLDEVTVRTEGASQATRI